MKWKKINGILEVVLLSCLLINPQVRAFPQSPPAFFIQQLDNRNGLSNSSINNLYSDADSMLWVATWDGLNMYDGSTFHVFNYSKENNYKTIGSNVIQGVSEDHLGNIWISTIEGISRYNKHTGKFQNYFYNQYQRGSIGELEYQLAVNQSGEIFCLTTKYGLTKYNAQVDSFYSVQLPRNNSPIQQLCFDDAGSLWLLNAHGDLETYSGDDFQKKAIFQEAAPITRLFHVCGRMWYATAETLFEVNNATHARTGMLTLTHPIAAMTWYHDHFLVAWSTKGYSVFEGDFRPSGFLKEESRQMKDIRVTSLVPGAERILWVGTDGNGIIKMYPKTTSFGMLSTADNNNPYNKSVRAFCEENGDLWFGTKGSGIITVKNFDPANTSFSKENNFLFPEQLDNNAVYALLKGNDGLIYIGTDGKGVGVYDIKTKHFNKWLEIDGHDLFPAFGSVYAMLQDSDRSLWLGTSGYGLIHMKINRNVSGKLSLAFVEKFAFNNNNKGPANDIIYGLADGGNGKLWIGCRYGGLSLLDKKTRNFKTFKAFTYEESLSNNDVLSVYKDSHNRVWVGTSYGLNYIDPNSASSDNPVFKKYTTANGLPNNTIHGITEDALGNIWASTNRGLVQVSPETGKIFTYQQTDGLQSNEFCDGAVWKDQAHRLFFGGTYGINFFLPQDISRSKWLPNLLVSGISMGGKPAGSNSFLVLRPDEKEPSQYAIGRKDNFFELDVKAINFLKAEKCEYSWMLENYDNTWHFPGTSGKISYNNILPGTYTLKVKWSNGEGIWTQEVALIQMNVKEYIWLRWYALTAYVCIAAFILWLIYKHRKNRSEIKRQLAVEHAMRTREEEIHEDRISFFTNIAHELQTPLTLIMGSIERFIDQTARLKGQEAQPYYFSVIHQQASKLTYLVHQLMEFRKMEFGFFNNQYNFLNLSELLHHLAEPFSTLSEVNAMTYDIHIASAIKGWTDKDKLEKIMFNLLSNAFKHTERGGKVIFSAFEYDGQLELTVANSGCSLTPEQLNRLFDKFYASGSGNLDNGTLGTGIGLAFARQLVTLLNGEIAANSENGWISFVVRLPITQATGTNNIAGSEPSSGKPSYLYRSVTAYHNAPTPPSVEETNKRALMETLDDSSKPNVLIVEDDPEIRFLLADILKDNYIISEAGDGIKALELMQRMVPDLIICDVMMPHMNGLEFCNTVKITPSTCHIPVIMLSARDTAEQHMEGYEVGADAYIAKPFHTTHLQIRTRKLIENARRLHTFFKDPDATGALAETSIPAEDKEFLLRLVKLIEENMDEPEFGAASLEKSLALSKMQLYRRLKTLTGMTPGEFIRHVRLKHAAQLLATTRMTVSEIFHKTGFNNQSYFFREFKRRYHLAPNEYRSQLSAKLNH